MEREGEIDEVKECRNERKRDVSRPQSPDSASELYSFIGPHMTSHTHKRTVLTTDITL